jgi:hypothetical protein
VLPNEVFDLLREVVVHRHPPTSHAPIAPATPPLNGYKRCADPTLKVLPREAISNRAGACPELPLGAQAPPAR